MKRFEVIVLEGNVTTYQIVAVDQERAEELALDPDDIEDGESVTFIGSDGNPDNGIVGVEEVSH